MRYRTEHYGQYRRQIEDCRLRLFYGLGREVFDRLVLTQGGRCAICNDPMRPPCVDHDHATGEVRGLLCLRCNTAIAFLRERPALFTAAVAYLASRHA